MRKDWTKDAFLSPTDNLRNEEVSIKWWSDVISNEPGYGRIGAFKHIEDLYVLAQEVLDEE